MVHTQIRKIQMQILTHLFDRFGKNVDDGLISREVSLTPHSMTSYKINVYTGNVNGAGTDSNVHVTLFGDLVCLSFCSLLY